LFAFFALLELRGAGGTEDGTAPLHVAPELFAVHGAHLTFEQTVISLLDCGNFPAPREGCLRGRSHGSILSTRRGILGDEPTFARITLIMDPCNLQEKTNR
jgi:hypothetical protein